MAQPIQRYIGLMSGTSLDGIDAAILEVSEDGLQLSHHINHDIPPTLHQQLLSLCSPGDNEIVRMGNADYQLGIEFAKATQTLLSASNLTAAHITAIGSHGQTIRHHPEGNSPFTLQIGNASVISQQAGITTVADFRSRDIAAGGQGAPLTPAFHQAAFANSNRNRVIVNIGGMANITPLIKGIATQGFDTGPGNVLMDYWANKHKGTAYDQNGDWANSGEVNIDLLDTLLNDTYFALPAPKSTGREHFNSQWIEYHLRNKKIPANNIQTTLLQLTARSISQAIKSLDNSIDDVFICGGGALNQTLMNTLKDQLNTTTVDSTDSLGIAPEWVEAAAFAWLAHQTLNGLSGNIPQATGAKEACVLGAIHSA